MLGADGGGGGGGSDGGSDGSGSDAGPNIELVAVAPPIAKTGAVVTLEGTFSTGSTIVLPGGATADATVLGSHRATINVPTGATIGDLALTAQDTTTGRVAFHAVTFDLGMEQFANYDQTDTAREPNQTVEPRLFHGTVTLGNNVYVIGGLGTGNAPLSDVEHATINADGSLGALAVAPGISLVTGRSEFATVVVGNFVYVIGGQNGADLTSVESAPIHADNTLGTFSTVAGVQLTQFRGDAAAVVIGDYLYVIGGYLNGTGSASVERAAIASDGTISNFEVVSGVTLATDPDTNMTGRAGLTATVIANNLYIVGGSGNYAPTHAVQVAPINPDGTIGTFSVVVGVTLVAGRYAMASAVLGDYLYAIGGGDDFSNYETPVERAPINLDGSIGTFEQIAVGLPETRIGLTIASAGNALYAIGGEQGDGQTGLKDVARVSFDVSGSLGTSSPVTGVALDAAAYGQSMVTVGADLYVIGGTTASGDLSSAVQSATVTDGMVGTFATESGAQLTTARAGAATAVVGNYVYVIGGTTDAGVVGTIERAPIAADGTLGTFEAYGDATLVTPRANASVVVVSGYAVGPLVLVIGGIGADGTILGNVEVASVAADGSIGAFAIDPDAVLQTARYAAGVFVHLEQNGYVVYVSGGIGASGYLDDVERGTVTEEAHSGFGGFGVVSGITLGTPRAGHAVAILGNNLYVIGGIGAGGYLESIESAPFSGDPTAPLDAFTTLAGVTLTDPRAYMTTVVIANQLYTVGGQDETGAVETVEAAPLE